MNRRDFVYKSGIGAIGLGLLSKNLLADGLKKSYAAPGIQLYTLRKEIEADLIGTLKAVAKLGYENLEGYQTSAGHFFGKDPKEFKKIIDDLGMRYVSSHVASGLSEKSEANYRFNDLYNQPEKFFEQCKIVGQEFAVCPWISKQWRDSEENAKRLAETLNKAGEMAKSFGIKVAYHNHAFEFEKLKDSTFFDYLISNTNADKVWFEIDLYWVSKAGLDPIEFLKLHNNRIALWHVKDKGKDKGDTVEVGNGSIDYATIFKKQYNNLNYWFVEQDQSTDPIKSVETSINYLKNNIL